MAQLAIIGHATRGKEVIEILEMLGGVNHYKISCADLDLLYTIRSQDNFIIAVYPTNTFVVFTLEEFLEKFPYKVGDKVSSKYLKNYKIEKMEWKDTYNRVIYKLQGMGWYGAEELQPYKEETMEDKHDLIQQLKEYFENTPREVVEKEWHEYDKYNEINPKVNEYLEYVNNIRQPKYPKTYEECCEVLDWNPLVYDRTGYKFDLLCKLQVLLICRDAYWKIADDWEPDWTKADERKYCIVNTEGNITKWVQKTTNKILAFPTEEMSDVFYENFKELIEECKELL